MYLNFWVKVIFEKPTTLKTSHCLQNLKFVGSKLKKLLQSRSLQLPRKVLVILKIALRDRLYETIWFNLERILDEQREKQTLNWNMSGTLMNSSCGFPLRLTACSLATADGLEISQLDGFSTWCKVLRLSMKNKNFFAKLQEKK